MKNDNQLMARLLLYKVYCETCDYQTKANQEVM